MSKKTAQQGITSPFVLIILVIVLIGSYILYSKGLVKIPALNKVVPVAQTDSSVVLKAEYKNPFDASTQYTNPFSEQKNPFDNLK